MAISTCSVESYFECNMQEPAVQKSDLGNCVVYSSPCPGREGPNEDAAALIKVAADHCLLVLADGFGGHPAGAWAAATAIRQVEIAVCERGTSEDNLISSIVEGFEQANEAVRKPGAGSATTLTVVDIEGERARPYHVGDSAILIVGQRGRIKIRSIVHSPVGYAVESGLMDEQEAMNHAERHIVSNMVGSEEMRIEIGPNLRLAPRDTVIIGSDGLWDNVLFEEVVEIIRKGVLVAGVQKLVDLSHDRMNSPQEGKPSKADDLTLIAFRRLPKP